MELSLLLRTSDWEREGYDSIRLFSVQEMLSMRKDDWISKSLPTMVVIGTDSGGQFLAYDTRAGVAAGL
jgi:hypothetical protein